MGDGLLGSERMRCDWVAPHIPAVKWHMEPLEQYNTVIFQKVSPTGFPECEQLRILDMCDPVWRDHPTHVREALPLVQAVTVSSEAAKADFCQVHDAPCYVVPDAHDLDAYRPRRHDGRRYVWFGYSRNFWAAEKLVRSFPEREVQIVSDEPVGYGSFQPWLNDQVAFNVIGRSKVAVLPPAGDLKSNNRKITAWALRLDVIEDDGGAQDWEAQQDEVAEHSAPNIAARIRQIIGELQ